MICWDYLRIHAFSLQAWLRRIKMSIFFRFESCIFQVSPMTWKLNLWYSSSMLSSEVQMFLSSELHFVLSLGESQGVPTPGQLRGLSRVFYQLNATENSGRLPGGALSWSWGGPLWAPSQCVWVHSHHITIRKKALKNQTVIYYLYIYSFFTWVTPASCRGTHLVFYTHFLPIINLLLSLQPSGPSFQATCSVLLRGLHSAACLLLTSTSPRVPPETFDYLDWISIYTKTCGPCSLSALRLTS